MLVYLKNLYFIGLRDVLTSFITNWKYRGFKTRLSVDLRPHFYNPV